jgi:hypothetical protein
MKSDPIILISPVFYRAGVTNRCVMRMDFSRLFNKSVTAQHPQGW